MKKNLLLPLLCCSFILSSCGNFENHGRSDSGSSGSSATESKDVEILSVKNMRQVISTKEPRMIDSYKDYDTNYYFYEIGKLNNVPLDGINGLIQFRWFGTKTSRQFETSETTTQKITDTISTTLSETVSIEESLGFSIGGSGGKKDVFNVSAELSYEVAVSHSNSKSISSSHSTASEYSKSVKDIFKMDFDQNSKEGFYGFILTGSLTVYSLLTVNTITNEKNIFYYGDVNNSWFGFYFFETTNEFIDYKYPTINFDIPSDLPTPTETRDPFKKEEPPTAIYIDETKYNSWGTNVPYKVDISDKWEDIEKYKEYGYKNFIIEFKIDSWRDWHLWDHPTAQFFISDNPSTYFTQSLETFMPEQGLQSFNFTKCIPISAFEDSKYVMCWAGNTSVQTMVYFANCKIIIKLAR